MKNEDLFHYLRNAENIGKRKYKLMGFKNPKRIDELVELDLYFTTMVFLNGKEIVTAAKRVSDEYEKNVKKNK